MIIPSFNYEMAKSINISLYSSIITVVTLFHVTPTLNPNMYRITRAARIVDFTAPVHRAFSSPHEKTPIEDRISYTQINTRWHH
jgi:hypothetical protein